MDGAAYCELQHHGLIAVSGADAIAFLHAQLTSDVAGLAPLRTQYSGYCTPKGRLLATFLLWRVDDRVWLQLPAEVRESIQARLAKYVLRSKVALADATATSSVFGLWGTAASAVISDLLERAPAEDHQVVAEGDLVVTRLPVARYLFLVPSARAAEIREKLAASARVSADSEWGLLDIGAGIPTVSAETQEHHIPQMLNLDLIGGVSYSKGCYPGQEIVARTHYLGRLKQRMYRLHFRDAAPRRGDPLFSAAFGAQASGTIIAAAPANGGYEALAVLQTAAAREPLHWRTPDGPSPEIKPLPYSLGD